jgi:hypothetical protein
LPAGGSGVGGMMENIALGDDETMTRVAGRIPARYQNYKEKTEVD